MESYVWWLPVVFGRMGHLATEAWRKSAPVGETLRTNSIQVVTKFIS